jgi:N-acyl-L-homoserine lactone synthetase
VTDCLGETVGTIRLLRGGESGFMLDKEFVALVGENSDAIHHSSECAELSRLAVKPELSPNDRHDVAMCLYRAAYGWSGIHGVAHWYVVIELPFLKVLQRLGFPFRRIGRSYHFQPQVTTVAATLDLAEAACSLRTLDPDRLAWFEATVVSEA